MAAFLIKLHITATASDQTLDGGTVTTTVSPAVARYTTKITQPMIGTGTTTIGAASFYDDTGTALAADGLPLLPDRGYAHIYVNGLLQQGGLITSLTNAQLVLATDEIGVNIPVVLEIVNTTNAGSSSITVQPTVSKATIDIVT